MVWTQKGVIQFRKIIKEQAAKGKTIFFSSHILDEVQHVCNTICIISKGRMIAQGTLDEVGKKMRKDERMTIEDQSRRTMAETNGPWYRRCHV